MTAHKASLINAITLIIMGIWGLININPEIFSGIIENKSPFIPITLGVLIALCNNGIKSSNKLIAHIAVLLTIISFANLMPLFKAISNGRVDAAVRVSLMVLSSLFAMIYFVRSFIENRKKSNS